jgi:hypothetical protein
MEPSSLDAAQWAQISRLLAALAAFAGLALTAALSFALAHAVLPSLTGAGYVPGVARLVPRVLYPVAAVGLVLAGAAFVLALRLAAGVLSSFFPRFAI